MSVHNLFLNMVCQANLMQDKKNFRDVKISLKFVTCVIAQVLSVLCVF